MISWKNVFVFFVFVFFWFKPDQTPQMVHSTISWPQVFVLFWDFVLILSRLLWECLHILLLVSIGVLIWLQIYMFFEVRGYKFLREPEKKIFLTKNLKNINADSDLNYLLDNSLFLIVTLFRTRFRYASRWTTQFSRHFFTLSLWRVFFHIFLFLGTSGYRPSWTIFSCGISWEIERKCDFTDACIL